MNDGNLPADQTIEQRRLAYVWPADDRDARHIRLAVHRLNKSLLLALRMRVPFGLQLAHTVKDVNHTRDESENSCDNDHEKQR